jgi:hypothetical protein
MARPVLAPVLRERLGTDGSSALADFVETYEDEWKKDVMTACRDRLDVRLQTLVSKDEFTRSLTDLRLAIRDDFSRVQQEMSANRLEWKQEMAGLRHDMTRELAAQRVELLRWSFLFWIGQIAAMAALIGVVLRFGR